MSDEQRPIVEVRQRIAAAAGAALLAAGLILVMFILPAEYGVDPLGTGARFGLLELGITGQRVAALESAAAAGNAGGVETIVPQERQFQQQTVTFTLAPGEGMEYKYRLDKGESLLYSWTTPIAVEFEFHAEPDGAPPGYAQTYEKSRSASASGTLVAPFPGIHGWYWLNGSNDPITVTLTAAGFYNMSHEFRAGQPPKNTMYQ